MKREIRLDNLFLKYGKERFLNWCRSLLKFRFIKSHPYPDDLNPDRFIALINYTDEDELRDLVSIMKIEINIEQRDVFDKETYVSNEAEVNDVSCYVKINRVLKNIELEVSGSGEDKFALDDSTFHRAKKIDDFLTELDIEFVSSPFDDDYCVTPEFYPDVWK